LWNPKGYRIGRIIPKYDIFLFNCAEMLSFVEQYYHRHKDNDATWIKRECAEMVNAVSIAFYDEEDDEILPYHVELWMRHVAYYCYLRGGAKKYLNMCLDAFMDGFKELFKEDMVVESKYELFYESICRLNPKSE
jgi:hypothetical protein